MTSWLPIAISCAAFVVSLATYADRRRQDRRDLFLRLHDRLTEPDIQGGRRILYQEIGSVEDAAELRVSRPADYALVNRALAMFDVAAMYVAKGYVDRELFLAEWSGPFAAAWRHGRHFLEDRPGADPRTAWPHFQALGREVSRRSR